MILMSSPFVPLTRRAGRRKFTSRGRRQHSPWSSVGQDVAELRKYAAEFAVRAAAGGKSVPGTAAVVAGYGLAPELVPNRVARLLSQALPPGWPTSECTVTEMGPRDQSPACIHRRYAVVSTSLVPTLIRPAFAGGRSSGPLAVIDIAETPCCPRQIPAYPMWCCRCLVHRPKYPPPVARFDVPIRRMIGANICPSSATRRWHLPCGSFSSGVNPKTLWPCGPRACRPGRPFPRIPPSRIPGRNSGSNHPIHQLFIRRESGTSGRNGSGELPGPKMMSAAVDQVQLQIQFAAENLVHGGEGLSMAAWASIRPPKKAEYSSVAVTASRKWCVSARWPRATRDVQDFVRNFSWVRDCRSWSTFSGRLPDCRADRDFRTMAMVPTSCINRSGRSKNPPSISRIILRAAVDPSYLYRDRRYVDVVPDLLP